MLSRNKHAKYMRRWRKRRPNYYRSLKWKIYKRNWTKNKRKLDKQFYNKELIKNKLWKRSNREKINPIRNNYDKNKRKIDNNFKILCNLRIRICNTLKRNTKSVSTLNLLGCSIEFLKKHLQSKFQSGMSFSNYGKWHIDHIRPCKSFDLSKVSEQRKCFNYTNLQPLWARDNLSKGDKYIG
jgi:hypothetical protein